MVAHLEAYAAARRVREHTTVLAVRRDGRAATAWTPTTATWRADNVVIATGDCDVPHASRPRRRARPRSSSSCTPTRYRRPGAAPRGGVLVVGAGPSGQQIAAELLAAGRLVVARHRPPRARAAPLPRPRHVRLAAGARRSSTRAPTRCATWRRPGAPRASRSAACAAAARSGSTGSRARRRRHRAPARLRRRARAVRARPARSHRRGGGAPAPRAGQDRRARRAHAGAATGTADPPPPVVLGPGPDGDRPARRHRHGDLGDRLPARLPVAAGARAGHARASSRTTRASRRLAGLFALGLRFQRTRRSHFLGGVGDDAAHVARAIARPRPVAGGGMSADRRNRRWTSAARRRASQGRGARHRAGRAARSSSTRSCRSRSTRRWSRSRPHAPR